MCVCVMTINEKEDMGDISAYLNMLRETQLESWGTGKTWETMATPKKPTHEHLNDLFIMQLRLKKIIYNSSFYPMSPKLITFMQFHLVSFAHNIDT